MYIYIQTEILPNLNHGTCGYVGSAFVLLSWVSLNLGLSAIRGKDIRKNQ